MRDNLVYDTYRFRKDLTGDWEGLPILIDLYSTGFYSKYVGNTYDLSLYTIEELREIYEDINKVKKNKSEPLYWYDYDFKSLLEK